MEVDPVRAQVRAADRAASKAGTASWDGVCRIHRARRGAPLRGSGPQSIAVRELRP
jgi:hypothetical protein